MRPRSMNPYAHSDDSEGQHAEPKGCMELWLATAL